MVGILTPNLNPPLGFLCFADLFTKCLIDYRICIYVKYDVSVYSLSLTLFLDVVWNRLSSTNNFLSSLSSSRLSLILFYSVHLTPSSSLLPVTMSMHTNTLRTVFAQWGRSWRGQGVGFTGQLEYCSPWLRPWSSPPLEFSWLASPSSTCLSCRCCAPSTYTWLSMPEHNLSTNRPTRYNTQNKQG